MKKILIVRLGSLGDLVHTLPAVAALRRRYPDAEIDWLVDAVHRPFLEAVPVLTRTVALHDRTARAWLAARAELRTRRYDVAVDFQGLLKSAALARLAGAGRVVGFERGALREGAAAWFYGTRVAVDEGQHVIRKNLQLARALGVDVDGALEFPIAPVHTTTVDGIKAQASRPLAIVNPGAAWPNKRWPPDRFGAVARALLDRAGIESIAIWGPAEESIARAVAAASGGAARVAPPTDLRDLIALSQIARFIVSGDTGPLHFACAVGVPAVGIFGPTDPARNGPWAPDDITISQYARCDCHYERRCRRDDARWCLQDVSAAQVIDASLERLRRGASGTGRGFEVRP
jgi:lipopolysaccharide heptosyltransferase I